MDEKYLSEIHELSKLMQYKSNTRVFLYLKVLFHFPKCLIKFFIENYVFSYNHMGTVPLRDLLTFSVNKITPVTSSKIKEEPYIFNYYSEGEVKYADSKSISMESIIISHKFKQVFIDRNFRASNGYLIGKFKPGTGYSKIYIQNMIHFYLWFGSINNNVKLKNIELPCFDLKMQKLFNYYCDKHGVELLSDIIKTKLSIKEKLEEIEELKKDIEKFDI